MSSQNNAFADSDSEDDSCKKMQQQQQQQHQQQPLAVFSQQQNRTGVPASQNYGNAQKPMAPNQFLPFQNQSSLDYQQNQQPTGQNQGFMNNYPTQPTNTNHYLSQQQSYNPNPSFQQEQPPAYQHAGTNVQQGPQSIYPTHALNNYSNVKASGQPTSTAQNTPNTKNLPLYQMPPHQPQHSSTSLYSSSQQQHSPMQYQQQNRPSQSINDQSHLHSLNNFNGAPASATHFAQPTSNMPPQHQSNNTAQIQPTWPSGQNVNIPYTNMTQDPNLMQQMALLMQQMQLAQQNGTMPGYQNGQDISGFSNYGNAQAGRQTYPFSNSQIMTPNHQKPSVISGQQQQIQHPNATGKSKFSTNFNNINSNVPPPQQHKNISSYSGPRKEVYILVLGETGVGKSTWINGIANYMSFDVITEALEAPEPVCVIPSKFTMCDDNYQQREIIIGNSTNEVFDNGQSATQDARTYMFQTPKYDVYIIDTPGIGDVRGIDQDKENTRKILNAIAPYKNLHAICLLFKSNEARMTLSFRYCISELLLQLHKDAAKNIVFFFTNSRGTFYKPGDTIVPLRAFLGELHNIHGIKVNLDKNNIFCLDNEAFKFVCAYHDGVDFSEEDMLNFASSWKRSAEETHRFLDYAADCPPHSVDKTLSVNQARGIILQLAKPLADINDLIETNIKVYNDRKNEIENTAATIDELRNKLLIPQVGITTEPLPYPMTVCTGSKCIETQSIPNSEQLQTIYKQICHDHCQLDNVDPERFPEPHLQQCWAMQGGQTCHICGCEWSTHMHIRFKQIKTNENVEDENIKNAIQTNEDARITKQKIIESCEKIVEEYKHEQKVIMDASIRFAVFLKQNAIMAYNDVFEKYVEKSIEEEEKCIRAGGDHSKLDNLKRCLAEYLQERAAIEHALKSGGNSQQQISTDDVKHMKSVLFALPHFGAKLKELFNRTVQGYALNQQQSVQKFAKPNFSSYPKQYKTKKAPKSHGIMDKMRSVFSGKSYHY